MHRQPFGSQGLSSPAPVSAMAVATCDEAGNIHYPVPVGQVPSSGASAICMLPAASAATSSVLSHESRGPLRVDSPAVSSVAAAVPSLYPQPLQKPILALKSHPLQESQLANIQHVESSLLAKPISKISPAITMASKPFPVVSSFEGSSLNPPRPKQCIRL